MSINANDIVELLKAKHHRDVIVTGCKIGPTHGGVGTQRFDAWVMSKSWVHPQCTGYKVKITRGDFMRDEKWRGYLPYCNCLYFVCPAGLIAKDECPGECGLMWVSKVGSKLYTKRKAPYREVVIPGRTGNHGSPCAGCAGFYMRSGSIYSCRECKSGRDR